MRLRKFLDEFFNESFTINNIFDELSDLTRSSLSLEAVCYHHCYSSRLPDLMFSAICLLYLFLDSFPHQCNIRVARRNRVSSFRLTSVRCMSLKSRTGKLWSDQFYITVKSIYYQWEHLLLKLWKVSKSLY